MTNWKKLKIIKEPRSSFFENISFELSEYVPYKHDKHEGRIDWLSSINCVDSFPFNSYQVGDYIEVDIDKTRNYKFVYCFDDINIVRKVGSSNEIVSRNNNIPSISRDESGGIINVLNEAINSDTRNEYETKINVDSSGKYSGFSLIGRRK